VALEVHRLLARDAAGRWRLGPRLAELAGGPAQDVLLQRAGPVLARLRDTTGESAQLYLRRGDVRVCLAAAERGSGLRDTVPVGAELPLTAGSAGQVLLAWSEDDEAGVGSVSAPVRDGAGTVVAAVSVSGPLERLTRSPGRLHAAAVCAAGAELSRTD
jgi:DNA-binding IclR family transcriptional regulator